MRRRIVIAVFDRIQLLDVTGPSEVFAAADRLAAVTGVRRHADGPDAGESHRLEEGRYTIELASADGRPVRSSSGLLLGADAPIGDVTGPIDTLIVPGGPGVREALAMAPEIDRLAGQARRVASVCTGAFLLAATGRLAGRRATTHWASTDRLATEHPDIHVENDPIFVRDDPYWTSAGVTAGIDLCLALVASDHGQTIAADVARWLVMFLQRPGGQAQFSVPLQAAGATDVLGDLQVWVVEHPAADLSVAALADRCHMAPRSFQRFVRRELGMTPGEWVEQIRVEAARRALEAGDESVASIAEACGFRTLSTLYRAFDRRLGVTPASYRSHFNRRRAS